MALTEIQQTWVYKKIDGVKERRIFGLNFKKPSDICKELRLKTNEEIDILIAKEKADAIAAEETKIAEANAAIAKLQSE